MGLGAVPIPAGSLDTAAHVVQLALTPIFLLTAVGSLLNVFSSRLARVVDRIHVLKREEAPSIAELDRLRLRSQFLDVAVLAAAVAGGLTCCAAGTIFFGVLRDAATASLLFGLFGLALIAATGALFCFATEVMLSGRAVRANIDETKTDAPPANAAPGDGMA